MLYYTVFSCILLYFVVLHFILLSCINLYNVALYHIMLFNSTVPYHILLHLRYYIVTFNILFCYITMLHSYTSGHYYIVLALRGFAAISAVRLRFCKAFQEAYRCWG